MKPILRYLMVLLYLVTMAACLLMVVKPGASIFYLKKTINKQELVPDAGFAYRYKLNDNPLFYRVDGILLFENGQALIPSPENLVADTGNGNYSLSQSTQGNDYIYLSSSDNSDLLTNNREYTLYLPISFISRPLGSIYLIILIPGLAWFIFFALKFNENRQSLKRFPTGIFTVLNRFLEHAYQVLSTFIRNTWQQIKTRSIFWQQLFTITILAVYLYVLMEWIFYTSMPSFMSIISFSNKAEVLLLSGLAVSLFFLVLMAGFVLLDFFALMLHLSRLTIYLGIILPTAIFSSLALILIDNFTYTVFKFGISTSAGVGRILYAILLIGISIWIYIQMLKIFGLRPMKITTGRMTKRLFFFSLTLLAVSIGLAWLRPGNRGPIPVDENNQSNQASNYPNIILLGGDGLSAEHLSVYGYDRNTTPRLQELAESSLVAENAFTNAGNSAGSVISILTSKLPTTTRVQFSPDILTGVDSYQHLPGILKNEGYKTVEFGVPSYVDAYNLNLQNGFDMVNYRSQVESKIGFVVRKLGYDNIAYFIDRITERITDRILHIFFIRETQNPYALVTQPAFSIKDQEKIDQVKTLIDQTDQPLFIHAHLLGTHGPKFNPLDQVYSKGQEQDQPRMDDFYDDAILSFDHYVGEIIDHLKVTGQYDNTILVIYSDHSDALQTNRRIPLMIHFPDGYLTGRMTQNAENLDIAPTILDYLGLTIPDWMNGTSLLKSDQDRHRLIFSAGTGKLKNEDDIFLLDPKQIKPPFYQFNYINIIDCQKWYRLDLTSFAWSSGEVPGYTKPCHEDSLLSFEEIQQEVYQRLSADGFDISSLP